MHEFLLHSPVCIRHRAPLCVQFPDLFELAFIFLAQQIYVAILLLYAHVGILCHADCDRACEEEHECVQRGYAPDASCDNEDNNETQGAVESPIFVQ